MDKSGEKPTRECITNSNVQLRTDLMFIGEYQHNMDDKGRLAIPTKFRASLKKAVVTRGIDNCLCVYTMEEWEKVAVKLAALPVGQANNRAYSRLMLAGAMDFELDAQGRAVLPEYLRKYAGLHKEVVVAGLYNRLELWDKHTWEQYKQKSEKHSEAIAEQLGSLGV